jgi:hypothetical protein
MRWRFLTRLLWTMAVVFLIAGCGGSERPTQNSDVRLKLVGDWQVTAFEQHDPKMYTCFGNDAAVEFRADGTWTGFNRGGDHDTYAGTYALSGQDQIKLVAGVTQKYTLTLNGDAMTLRSGKALLIQLQRTATPAASSLSPSGGTAGASRGS